MPYEPPAGILIGPAIVESSEDTQIEEFLPRVLADIEDLGQDRKRPALVPIGIVRSAHPESHQTFTQMFDVWIRPEVARRVQSGVPQESLLPLRQALIVFPPRSRPERYKVLLNDEVRPRATVLAAYTGAHKGLGVGAEVNLGLRDMFDMREFTLEGVEMDVDGFAWIRREGNLWAVYFNFLPNSGIAESIVEEDHQRIMRSVQDAIAQEMLQGFMHDVFTDDESVRTAMSADGWCPTPVLLPHPWRQMCEAYARSDPGAAEAAATAAVGDKELNMMLASWVEHEPFKSDRRFLETGIRHYLSGDYLSAVSVLLPRIEGLANRVRKMRGIGARDSISKVFQSLDQLSSERIRDGFLASRIRSEFESLVTSFLLAHFRPSANDADETLGRHAHAHGATGDPHYDQAYALKIILALDALYFIAR